MAYIFNSIYLLNFITFISLYITLAVNLGGQLRHCIIILIGRLRHAICRVVGRKEVELVCVRC